jgi:trehalose 6-phosphate synthase
MLPDAAQSRAVLIGTSSYDDDELPDLDSVRANLTDLEERLADERFGAFRQIQTVLDPSSIGKLGSVLAKEARAAEDTFLVYYAGHGLVDEDGELYLALTTTESDVVYSSAMPFTHIRRAVRNSPAQNRVAILDCCYSGRAIQAMSDPDSVLSGQIEIAGGCVLTSSSATQISHAPEGERHTAFTGELLEVLTSGLPDVGEFITLDAVYTRLARRLPARSLPRPRIQIDGTAGRLALARNPAWSPPPPPPPKVELPSADFVVVTARLPIEVDEVTDLPRWTPQPDGVRAALGRVSGQKAWVGWPGAADQPLEPFEDGELAVLPVPLSEDEVRAGLEQFGNATIWPLYHDTIKRPEIDRAWWNSYVRVNRRFAEACAEPAAPGATVWVHDYQLQLVPAMLRELRPDLRIGFFLHIPFPPTELFMQLPWRTEIIRGLLGADLVGFHRPGGGQNYLWLARRLIGLEPSRGAVGVRTRPGVVQVGDRSARVGAFPGSIDSAAVDATARSSEVLHRARHIRQELGNPTTVLLGAQRLGHVEGVGELGYILGITQRLQALYELLAEGRLDPNDLVVVELVAFLAKSDSRRYVRLGADIEQIVARINGQFSPVGRQIVHYRQQAISPEELIAYYTVADVLAATPLRDGMNLVAKEYVASRTDLGGALVLSEFSGTAAELTSAFLVNPHDLDGMKNAMHAAATVDPPEGRRRMRALRRQVLTHDSERWAGAFLDALPTDDSTARQPDG